MKKFVSECLQPVEGAGAASGIVTGEPILPSRFMWRHREYQVADVLEKWKESSPCRHSAKEQYLRKHWYKVQTTTGEEMAIYFERQARARGQQKQRWWIYTVTTGE